MEKWPKAVQNARIGEHGPRNNKNSTWEFTLGRVPEEGSVTKTVARIGSTPSDQLFFHAKLSTNAPPGDSRI
ncbi:unnamed protein product [Prunus armeniaca]|uniref:Uncharacterized protein n=1 Tax=Prunus armeniaca TaxID=36596 RepID=A0A6J5W218_PRUAR|nr:unnamed protein product [Prunus armeniaca]